MNRHLLLELIRLHQPISRAQLSKATGMVRSNVSSVVDELIADRLVTERIGVPSGRGRVPLFLELNDNAYPLFAVNLRSGRTTVALSALSGRVRDSCTMNSHQDPRKFVIALAQSIESLAGTHGIRLKHVRGVGVSVPGLADAATGSVVALPFFPEYDGFPLAAQIEQLTGIRANVENDCNLAAMSLLWHGNSGDEYLSSFVLLDAGDVGLGAGIAFNREVYRGHDKRFAAEVGHMVVNPDGPQCRCGRHGCLELYATDLATWQRYAGSDKFDSTGFPALVEAAEAGDAAAIGAFGQTEKYLAIAIGNIACALNPPVVIVSGQITRIPGSLKRIQGRLSGSMFAPVIRPAPLQSDELFLRGAVCLACEKLFRRPSLVPAG